MPTAARPPLRPPPVSRPRPASRPPPRRKLGSKVAGVAVLILIALFAAAVRRVGRFMGRTAGGSIHLSNPKLEGLESEFAVWLQKSQAELQAAARTPDGLAFRGAQEAILETAVARLEPAASAAGLQVEERRGPLAEDGWATSSIRAAAGGSAAEALQAVDRLELPAGAWVESLRCTRAGCSVVLSATTRPLQPAVIEPPGSYPELPERPWWPPDRSRWDRISGLAEELKALQGPLRQAREQMARRAEGERLQELLVVLKAPEYRRQLLEPARAAAAAGLAEFEVKRAEAKIEVVLPEPSAPLQDALRRLGQVEARGPGYVLRPEAESLPARIRSRLGRLPSGA